ncbi:MAG: transglutaminase-like domain-containing protein [Candidatus Omnitrophota bacterium]|nr:transglutaminase-like domain-containing protein [Candidatus Omnitrophota bacterium]
MKKLIAAAWVFVLSTALVLIVSTADANAQLHSQPLSISSIAQQLQTPDAIAKYLWRHFSFETDQRQFGQEEYWQSPSEFMTRGKGDCEDFAILASSLLKQSGVKSFIVNIYGSRFAHTICVFEENGKLNAIDGSEIKRLAADSLEELAKKIHADWDRVAIVSPSTANPHQARLLKMISRK